MELSGQLPEQRALTIRPSAAPSDGVVEQDVCGRAYEGVLPAAGRSLRAAAGALDAAEGLVVPAHVQVRVGSPVDVDITLLPI